jgi:hypothetical protein
MAKAQYAKLRPQRLSAAIRLLYGLAGNILWRVLAESSMESHE